jgi:hypothetical protein
MSVYIYRIEQVRCRLKEEIRRELKQRYPDGFKLARLKKLRLALKDRLAQLSAHRGGQALLDASFDRRIGGGAS